MREFNFKNLEKDIICQDFLIREGRINTLNINDNTYSLLNIPSLDVGNLKYFILQKNMSDYLVIINKNEGIEYSIKIQQDIINNKAKIVDIYFHMYISSENSLCNFVNFTNQNLTNFYTNYIPYLLNYLPLDSNEINWYKNEITDLITSPKNDNVIKQKSRTKKTRKYNVKSYIIDGKKYNSITDIAQTFNMAKSTLALRLEKGMSIEEAISTPIANTGKRLMKIRKENE